MNFNMTRLAKLAGVSQSTVSKAFSKSSEISEKTRQHIFEVAREHGLFDKYNKNKFDKKVIGVIIPEITSAYYSAFASFLEDEIKKSGGIMTLSVSNFKPEVEEELFSYYVSYCNVDGVILINSGGNVKNPLLIPTVAISSSKHLENIETIKLDWGSSVENAVFYLKDLGHTKIGFVGEQLTKTKQLYFENALRKAGLSVQKEWIKVSQNRFEEAGTEVMEAWVEKGNLPSAILAAYDYIAIGIIKVLKDHGIRVPEDISVIGMDDISVTSYLETPLSTIRSYTPDVCRKAVELIMKKMENQYYTSQQELVIATDFIPRASSGPAPKQ